MIPQTKTKSRGKGRAPILMPVVESFLWPLSPSQFFRNYWHKQAFFSQGPVSRLKRLLSDLKIKDTKNEDIASLIRTHNLSKIVAYFVNSRGRGSLLTMPMEGNPQLFRDYAADLYQAGFSVALHLDEPSARSWRSRLASALGITDRGTMILFTSARSAFTGVHFDYHEAFSVQLSGVKRWWVAPNSEVDSPTEMCSGVWPFEEELRRYIEKPPNVPSTTEMKTFDASPGSVTYIPRGVWHGTESTEDSLSFNLAFIAEKWIDVLLQTLRNALITRPEWRRSVDGAYGNARSRSAAREQFEKMVPELVETLSSLGRDMFPEDRFNALGRKGSYQKNLLATFCLPEVGKNGTERVNFDHGGLPPRKWSIDLPSTAVDVCRWIKSSRSSFGFADIERAFPNLETEQIRELMSVLVKTRFVRPE